MYLKALTLAAFTHPLVLLFFSFSQLHGAFSQSEDKEEFSELRRDHGGLSCSDVDLGLSPDNQDIHMDTTSLFVSSASVLS